MSKATMWKGRQRECAETCIFSFCIFIKEYLGMTKCSLLSGWPSCVCTVIIFYPILYFLSISYKTMMIQAIFSFGVCFFVLPSLKKWLVGFSSNSVSIIHLPWNSIWRAQLCSPGYLRHSTYIPRYCHSLFWVRAFFFLGLHLLFSFKALVTLT